MKTAGPPLAERLTRGLKDGVEAARGERDDLVETWIDLDAADEGIKRSVHGRTSDPAAERPQSGG